MIVEPAKGTRIGVTYVSQVDLDFYDRPELLRAARPRHLLLANPPQIDLGMTVPQSVMVGVYQELSPKWAVMADAGWQDWSQFGEVDVGVETVGGPSKRSLTSSITRTPGTGPWAPNTGLREWRLCAGVAFDSSAVEDENRTVVLPMGQTWRFGLGRPMAGGQAVSLGAGYEFLWAGDMSVDQGIDGSWRGRVSGGFNDSWFSFFTANLAWRF